MLGKDFFEEPKKEHDEERPNVRPNVHRSARSLRCLTAFAQSILSIQISKSTSRHYQGGRPRLIDLYGQALIFHTTRLESLGEHFAALHIYTHIYMNAE